MLMVRASYQPRAAGSPGTSRPGRAADATSTRAPCAWATLSTIDRPRPVPGGAPGGRCVKKRRKILRLVLGRDAGAGVAHRRHQRPLLDARAEDDAPVGRGLHQRVVDQVAQHLLPAPAVERRARRPPRRAWPRRRTSSRRRADRARYSPASSSRNGPIAVGSRASAAIACSSRKQRHQVVDRSAQPLDRFADRARHQVDALGRQRAATSRAARPTRRWSPAGS